MPKYEVTIKEIHDTTATVELPEGATKDEILEAAEKAYEEDNTDMPTEYSRPMDKDNWTVLDLTNGNFV